MRAKEFANLNTTSHDEVVLQKLINKANLGDVKSAVKLQDLFKGAFGKPRDYWIRKYKKELEECGVFISEGVETPQDEQKIKHFIEWSYKALNMQDPKPKFHFSRDTEQAQTDHRTGMHTEDGSILIYIENRNLVDIMRTIFHELVHHRQDQLNMIKDGDSYPGSPIEAMADMMAGKYIKIYGKQHPEIFQ
jgi:hypothetical protein